MTKIIGLTGGIGSGKTTIAHYFEAQGIPVFIADDQAREIMKSTEILSEIKKIFGNSIFENDILDRKKLAEIVFNNPKKLQLLNAIIHPAVKKQFEKWILEHKKSPLLVYESAILFETKSNKNCDYTITISAPIETKIQRVMQRDKSTREAVMSRMNMQWTDAQRESKSDFTIVNESIDKTKLEFEKILKILNN